MLNDLKTRVTKKKLIWSFAGMLVVGLAALAVSCGSIEPPNAPVPVAKIAPPIIPHTLEGRSDCRLCHATGLGGAPQFPADHTGRPSDVCIGCHIKAPLKGSPAVQVPDYGHVLTPSAPTATGTPATVSAKDLFAQKCAACHGVKRQGTPGLAPPLTPESLTPLTDDQVKATITDGRSATAMQPFKSSLTPEEIDALVQFLKHTSP